MSESEKFLTRWARLKRATVENLPATAPAAAPTVPAAALPPLETLDFASDFSGFLQPQVEESLKRAALKKLFHSEHFNRMDGLDVYIDDYNTFEPIPEEMLRRMEQARGLLFPQEEEKPPAADALANDAAAERPVAEEVPEPLPAELKNSEET